MKAAGKDDQTRPQRWLLRRSDQCVVAVLASLALCGTIAWWLGHGGCRGTLVQWEEGQPRQPSFQVDINTAAWPELSQLPGIGETLAQRIVAYREEHGPFRTHEDLVHRNQGLGLKEVGVKGIGEKTLERIRPYLLPIPPPQ